MTLLSIIISKCLYGDTSPVLLSCAYDVSSMKFYQKKSAQEGMRFITRLIVPRVDIGSRDVIEHDGNYCFCLRWLDGLAVVMVSDDEYPERVAFTCLVNCYESFKEKIPKNEWINTEKDNQINFTNELESFLAAYQDPSKLDKVVECSEAIERANQAVHKSVKSVLLRGESIGRLVDKSEDLSDKSKMFYKTTKKLKCCVLQ
eukprot:GHVL01019232.1.p1 GENE.GHVL01019232.1~~GHVL01019232.1.p1  ORF type:complete len:202 (-),score=31.28 GHVL01019232.1:39-644(-)